MQLGKYIIKDPKICHGEPVFIGTRIFVGDVLDQVAKGLDGMLLWMNGEVQSPETP